jgi:hypothetical protein
VNEFHEPPNEAQVHAQAAALRALAAYLEYIKSIEDIEDMAEYEERLNMYVKGAGSVYLDQIDATGAFERTLPADEDPNFAEYANGLIRISFHAMATLLQARFLAKVLCSMMSLEFCDMLRAAVEEDMRNREREG